MRPKLTAGIALAAVLLLTALVFSGVPRFDFVSWDDNVNIYENPYFHPVTAAHLKEFWPHSYRSLYIPLTYTAWGFIATVARRDPPHKIVGSKTTPLDPMPFHAFNVGLHLINVALVFFVLMGLLKAMGKGADSESTGEGVGKSSSAPGGSQTLLLSAAAGALLFGVHPMQVEPVAWITELKGVLCTTFSLGALLLWINSCDASRKLLVWGVPVFMLLALLSKPSAVILPILVWILYALVLRQPKEAMPVEKRAALVLMFLLAGAWSISARAAQPTAGVVAPQPPWLRPFVMGDAYTFYLRNLLAPVGLSPDYGRTPALALGHWWGYCTWIPCVALTVLALWFCRTGRRPLGAAVFFAEAVILPVSGLVPFLFQQYSTVSDRYFYLAMLGPALALAWLLGQGSESLTKATRSARYAAVFSGLFLYGVVAWMQTFYWQDNFALYRRTLEVNPHSWMAQINLGDAFWYSGRPDLAEPLLREALTMPNPPSAAYINMGAVLADLHRPEEALEMYGRAEPVPQSAAKAHYGEAQVYAGMRQWEDAASQYRQALNLVPGDAKAPFYVGNLFAQNQRPAEAAEFYQMSVQRDPSYVDALQNLGLSLMQLGQRDAAVAQWKQALTLDPNFEPAKEALEKAQPK